MTPLAPPREPPNNVRVTFELISDARRRTALSRGGAHGVRLDSGAAADAGEDADRWSRWSYEVGPPRMRLTCDARTRTATLHRADAPARSWDDPLEALRWMTDPLTDPPTPGPPFKGGWIGHLSYDLGRLFETLPETAEDDLAFPLFDFTYHDSVLAHDRVENRSYLLSSPNDSPLLPVDARERRTPSSAGEVVSNFTRRAYESAVQRGIDYIRAGDVFQVNLSQRFTAALPASPGAIYEKLRRSAPAWFGALLDRGDHALICNSPELFLRITPGSDGRRVLTRPIKGTRPRAPSMRVQLRDSAKDQAELNMIVDLERNDLGRVCRIGSVKVTEPRVIEAHPTVYHGAATVEGVLRDDVGFVDLLRAAFPGGSVTGAPKIRAMQIIEELEPHRRGPYCGAIGFLSVDGHIAFNVAIRTMIVKDNRIHIPVGGGVVADSTPAEEYEETLVKARAMFASLGIPRNG